MSKQQQRTPPLFKEGDRVTSVNFDGIRIVKSLWGSSCPHHYTVEPETGFAYEEKWLQEYKGGEPVRVTVNYTVYGAKDSHGNVATAVSDNDSNNVGLWNLKDAQGNDAGYESELYHLKGWCEEMGFTYFEQEYTKEIEI